MLLTIPYFFLCKEERNNNIYLTDMAWGWDEAFRKDLMKYEVSWGHQGAWFAVAKALGSNSTDWIATRRLEPFQPQPRAQYGHSPSCILVWALAPESWLCGLEGRVEFLLTRPRTSCPFQGFQSDANSRGFGESVVSWASLLGTHMEISVAFLCVFIQSRPRGLRRWPSLGAGGPQCYWPRGW